MNPFPQVAALKTREEVAAHDAAMRGDGHAVPAPTHCFLKHGEVIGGVSLAGAVTVFGWFHSEKCSARDTASLINGMENALRFSGVKDALVPVAADSPIAPHMAAMGYTELKTVRLFAKTL